MSFDIDQIKRIVKQVLHEHIGDRDFLAAHVRQWNADILTDMLHRLKQVQEKLHGEQMKYVVTVLMGEKTKDSHFGVHTALSCVWDGSRDGCVSVKWENEKIYSIVNVFGVTV